MKEKGKKNKKQKKKKKTTKQNETNEEQKLSLRKRVKKRLGRDFRKMKHSATI